MSNESSNSNGKPETGEAVVRTKRPSRMSYEERSDILETVSQCNVHKAESAELIKRMALNQCSKQISIALSGLNEGETLLMETRFSIVSRSGSARLANSSKRTSNADDKKWRKSVLQRDGYKCVECGSTDRLNAHHIKPWSQFPGLRRELSNGQTLCLTCHAQKHPELISWFIAKK